MLRGYAFFFDYREGIFKTYRGLFNTRDTKDRIDPSETEKERREREAEERKAAKWSWFGFFYGMAKGCPIKLKEILKLNFIYLLNVKSYEKENKKQTEN
jgi:hypothetical protein